jgi:adhesin/invasin
LSAKRFLFIKALNSLFTLIFVLVASACNPVGQTTIGQNFFPSVVLSPSNSTVTVSSAQVVSGSSVNVTVFLKDTNNAPYISTLPTISLQNSGGNSTGTFSAITNNGDGSYSASFTGGAAGSATTVQAFVNGSVLTSTLPTITVSSGNYSLANSIITVSSNSVASGSSINITLTVKDSLGNQASSGGLSVAFSNSGGTSTGNFSGITDQNNGTYTCAFTGAVGGSATSITATIQGNPVTSSLPSVTVTGGTPASITVVSGSGQAATAGSAVSSPLVALVTDSNSNPVAGVSVNWTVTAGGGSVSSCSTTNGSGLSQCTLTTGPSVGTNTITASVAGVSPAATFTETGTVGPAASISVFSGGAQSATINTALSSPLVAVVKDANSNVVSGVAVNWVVTVGGGTLSSCIATTNGSGKVQCTFTMGSTAGSAAATASVSGISPSATFNETANPGVPVLSYAGATGTSGTVGSAMSISPTTLNNEGASITNCVTKAATPILPAWATLNATTCAITGTPTSALSSTTYTIDATNSAGTSADATVTLVAAYGTPSAPTSLMAAPGNASVALTWTAPSGNFGTLTYSVYRGLTSGGESSTAVATGVSGTSWTDNSTNDVGNAPANDTNYYYEIKAVGAGGTSVVSNEASAMPYGTATKLVFTSQPASTTAASSLGSSIQVTAEDAAGVVVTSYLSSVTVALTTAGGATLSGTLSATPSNGIASFSGLSVNKVGAYTLTATASGLTPAVSSGFTITAGSASQFAFTASPTTAVVNGCAGPYTLTAEDSSGNATTVSSLNVLLSEGSGSGTQNYYSNSTCTTASTCNAGATANCVTFTGSASFYFIDGLVESTSITADSGAGSGLSPRTETTASIAVSALTADGSSLKFINSTSVTVTTPSTTKTGDFLVMAMEKDGGAVTITPPSGWTQKGTAITDAGNAGSMYVFYKVATALDASGGTNYTWTWSSGSTYCSAGMWAVTGAIGIDTYAGNTGTSSTVTLSTSSITTTHNDEFLIAAYHDNSGDNPTAVAPLTKDMQPNASGFIGGHASQAVAGSTGAFSTTGYTTGHGWQSVLLGLY